MWDIPRYRIRTYVRAKKRARIRQLEKPRSAFHLRRTPAELRVTEGFASLASIIHSQVVLNEVTATGLYLYAATPLLPGQQISITMNEPRRFYARGHVIACQRTEFEANVLSEAPHAYRVAIVFNFNNSFEREAIRRYVEQIGEKMLYAPFPALSLASNE